MRRLWTEEELSTLVKHYNLIPLKELSQMLPRRSLDAIRVKGNKLGLQKGGVEYAKSLLTAEPEFDSKIGLEDSDTLQEVWVKLQEFQASTQKLETYEEEVDCHIETDTPIIVGFLSDAHIGAPTGRYDEFEARIDLMASTPKFYLASVGDTVDNYLPNRKQSSGMFGQLVPPKIQKRLVEHQYMKLKGRWLAVVQGCHDEWSHDTDNFDWAEYLAAKLECPNLGFGGFINLHVGDETYRIHARHKFPRYNSSFNLTHVVKRMREQLGDFDIGVVAHHHQATVEQMVCGDGLDRMFMRTGSFKGGDRYARSLGYKDTGAYVPCVILYPDERLMLPFLHLESATIVLNALLGEAGGF